MRLLFFLLAVAVLQSCAGGKFTGNANSKAIGKDRVAGRVSVKGKAGRTTGTCPKGWGSNGTLCLSIRTDCASASSQVTSAMVPKANMAMPSPPARLVPFEIENVPVDRDLYLHATLDTDDSGCSDLTTKDLSLVAGCVGVKVSRGQDVTDMKILFDKIE